LFFSRLFQFELKLPLFGENGKNLGVGIANSFSGKSEINQEQTSPLSYPCDTEFGKGEQGIDVARNMCKLAEVKLTRFDFCSKAQVVLIYLGLPENEFSDSDAQIFSILSKERQFQFELEQARKKNN